MAQCPSLCAGELVHGPSKRRGPGHRSGGPAFLASETLLCRNSRSQPAHRTRPHCLKPNPRPSACKGLDGHSGRETSKDRTRPGLLIARCPNVLIEPSCRIAAKARAGDAGAGGGSSGRPIWGSRPSPKCYDAQVLRRHRRAAHQQAGLRGPRLRGRRRYRENQELMDLLRQLASSTRNLPSKRFQASFLCL